MEAIILAGGQGTRLRSVVADLPKPMASIAGRPFLFYQMSFLKKQGIECFVLAVGYLHHKVSEYFGEDFEGIPIKYVIEESPLGTGGGLRYALNACEGEDVLVCNGDTFFSFNLNKLQYSHKLFSSPFTFSVRKVYNTGRYGGMKIAPDAQVEAFVTKDVLGDTYINAGAYIVKKSAFFKATEGLEKFSLEDEYLAPRISFEQFYAVPFNDANFLDIGIPEDYAKSQKLIPEWVNEKKADITTVFLDRDGVVNRKIDNDYVRTVGQLEVLEGVPEWIAEQNNNALVLVVTNQRGVGRGLMTAADVEAIHEEIQKILNQKNAKIDKFYFCTGIDNNSPCRKPNTGMLEEASNDFGQIEKENAVLVGDSSSDLQAAKRFGCKAIFLTNDKPVSFEILENADLVFTRLNEVELNKL